MNNYTEEQQMREYFVEMIKNLDVFLNWVWVVSDVHFSSDLYELIGDYKGHRKIFLDETLPSHSIRIESLWNAFKQAHESNVVMDIRDTKIGVPDFTAAEYAIIEKLVQMGVSLFSTMSKKDREKYPEVIEGYPRILAKLMAKQI